MAVDPLPPGNCLSLSVIARSLGIHRQHIVQAIEEGQLAAVDLRSPGASRSCIRIPRISLECWLTQRQKGGNGSSNGINGKHVRYTERTTKPPRIAPLKGWKRDHPADALMAVLRR